MSVTGGARMSAVRQALRPRRRGVIRAPWLLALPGLAALFAFHFVPIVLGGYYAFTNWNGLTHATWLGVDNFREIVRDEATRGALWHTIELAVCFVVLVNAIGLALALGLNRAVKSRHLLRSVFFAPVARQPARDRLHLALDLPIRRRAQPGARRASASRP